MKTKLDIHAWNKIRHTCMKYLTSTTCIKPMNHDQRQGIVKASQSFKTNWLNASPSKYENKTSKYKISSKKRYAKSRIKCLIYAPFMNWLQIWELNQYHIFILWSPGSSVKWQSKREANSWVKKLSKQGPKV